MYYYKSKYGLVKFQKPIAKITQKLLGFRNISKLNYENSLSIVVLYIIIDVAIDQYKNM